MIQTKYFFLNGQKFSIKYDLTILDVTKYFNYNTSLLVLEYNNLIFHKKNWSKTFIKNNDKIEIVTIVGGG
jgi:sulfur carrier protein